MKKLIPTNRFRKDKKKMEKRGGDFSKLSKILILLQKNKSLPLSARPHKLTGNWNGFWECHIESDWLLIYTVDEDAVELIRTGTHADLFK